MPKLLTSKVIIKVLEREGLISIHYARPCGFRYFLEITPRIDQTRGVANYHYPGKRLARSSDSLWRVSGGLIRENISIEKAKG